MKTRIEEDGGPAFPRPASIDPRDGDLTDGNRYVESADGMSLRAWLAGKALTGLVARGHGGVPEPDADERLAARCVRLADAVIAELAKKGGAA